MPAIHYAQFLDASDPDQSADDVLIFPTTPRELRGGTFALHYIPKEDSNYASERVLLSVNATTRLDFKIYREHPDGYITYIAVHVNDNVMVRRAVEFDAMARLSFTFSGLDGHLTVSGADVGDGLTDGITWYVGHGAMRLGGSYGGASVARGWVSLPYAVQGAVEPSEDADPGAGETQSSWIVLM